MSGVVERIAKLHAKAESARSVGQHAEASAFDEKVAELLEREGLTIEVVEADVAKRGERVRPVIVTPQEFGAELAAAPAHPWRIHLATVVANYHGCATFWFGHHNGIGFVGAIEDRDAAVAMFCRLAVRLAEMAGREMDESERPKASGNVIAFAVSGGSLSGSTTASYVWFAPRDEQWRISYLCGAAQAIGERLAREWAERARARTNGLAIVPIGKREGLREWIAARIPAPSDDEESGDASEAQQLEPVDIRQDGFDEGARAAWALNLRAFELTESAP